jgi:hypothetical protein
MRRLFAVLAGLAVLASGWAIRADDPVAEPVKLLVVQKEFVTLEPILVTVRLDEKGAATLPAIPSGKSPLRFEITPAVKPRAGAKPLAVEGKTDKARVRLYDLLESFHFPAEGSFTIRAVVEQNGSRLSSAPVSITLRRPAKTDPEWGPVDRLHHMPWSNYITDAFCGDTFDLVKRWPDSKLAPYCHYFNGLHHQHKKEYDKAVASFRIVTTKYPDFALAADADLGLVECLLIQGKRAEAAEHTFGKAVTACRRDSVAQLAETLRSRAGVRVGAGR